MGMLSSGFLTIVSALILYPIGKGVWVNRIQARMMAIIAPLLAGIDVDIVSGKEYLKFTGPCVYVSNHQANLDMLVLAETLAERVVICAKSEIKFWPIIGQVLFAGQNIFIDRKNRKNAIDAMNSVGKRMKEKNLALWMYPEGTRTHQIDNSLGQFKKGAFHLAKQLNCPIVPIVASTYYPVHSFANLVLPPIQPEGTVDELMEKTRKAMGDALKTIKTIPKDQELVNSITAQYEKKNQ
ncbi:1-acylglycerol-3-phosphate O-acyltransferase [Boothiomyces sp. JEL0838]|nr:1-acylglycerol-3-phosphate O-acyltransferase [Boothiomyces sp. JEL0838]